MNCLIRIVHQSLVWLVQALNTTPQRRVKQPASNHQVLPVTLKATLYQPRRIRSPCKRLQPQSQTLFQHESQSQRFLPKSCSLRGHVIPTISSLCNKSFSILSPIAATQNKLRCNSAANLLSYCDTRSQPLKKKTFFRLPARMFPHVHAKAASRTGGKYETTRHASNQAIFPCHPPVCQLRTRWRADPCSGARRGLDERGPQPVSLGPPYGSHRITFR
jgi:hypothetical protein